MRVEPGSYHGTLRVLRWNALYSLLLAITRDLGGGALDEQPARWRLHASMNDAAPAVGRPNIRALAVFRTATWVTALCSTVLCVLSAGAGCSCSPPVLVDDTLTGIHVTFVLDGAPAVRRVRLSAALAEGAGAEIAEPIERPEQEGEVLGSRESLVVIVPDELGGAEVVLTAEGLTGDAPVAWARGSVVLVRGSLVEATLVLCGEGEVFHEGACRPGCLAGEDFFEPGESRGCLVCDPAETVWSLIDDCHSGEVCVDGECRPGCLIDGVLVEPGETALDDPCAACDPHRATESWSPLPEASPCGGLDGWFCDPEGECREGCVSEGAFYAPDAASAEDACLVCKPGLLMDGWVKMPEASPCGGLDGWFCDADGECREGCVLDGAFFELGEVPRREPCIVCWRHAGVASWSPLPAGTDCGHDRFCDGEGECREGCFIAGMLYAPLAPHPHMDCFICDPEKDPFAWTDACEEGSVCTPDGCRPGCRIDGESYTAGEVAPHDPCAQCNPDWPDEWTRTDAGEPCDDGDWCTVGTRCDEDGDCAGGEPRCVSTECRRATCEPTLETCVYANEDAGTPCGDGRLCDGAGECREACLVAGLVLHLDAAAIEGLGDGDAVSQWDDSSGLHHHVGQNDPSRRPTFQEAAFAGMPAVRFDGVDDELYRDDALGFGGNPDLTVFIVGRTLQYERSDQRFMQLGAADGAPGAVMGFGDGLDGAAFRYNNGNQVFEHATFDEPALGVWMRAKGTYDAGTFFMNGVEHRSLTSHNPGHSPDLSNQSTRIGASVAFSGGWRGTNADVAEVLVYECALGADSRRFVESSLASKWGVGLDESSLRFFTDFSEYAVGGAPDDWTRRWASGGGDWMVREDAAATGGRVLRSEGDGSSDRRLLSWDILDGASADVETFFRFRFAHAEQDAYSQVRGQGDASTATAMRMGCQREDLKEISRYSGGSWTQLATAPFSQSFLVDTWYHARAVSSGAEHRLRIWRASEDEPGHWDLEATDEEVMAPGWIGLFVFTSFGGGATFDVFGVGLHGAIAPSEPPDE